MKPAVFKKVYGSACFWCGVDLVHHVSHLDASATRDHVVSRLFRRKGERVPIVAACKRCNIWRNDIENTFSTSLFEFKNEFDFLRHTTKLLLQKLADQEHGYNQRQGV